jgi:hypothetical protein
VGCDATGEKPRKTKSQVDNSTIGAVHLQRDLLTGCIQSTFSLPTRIKLGGGETCQYIGKCRNMYEDSGISCTTRRGLPRIISDLA